MLSDLVPPEDCFCYFYPGMMILLNSEQLHHSLFLWKLSGCYFALFLITIVMEDKTRIDLLFAGIIFPPLSWCFCFFPLEMRYYLFFFLSWNPICCLFLYCVSNLEKVFFFFHILLLLGVSPLWAFSQHHFIHKCPPEFAPEFVEEKKLKILKTILLYLQYSDFCRNAFTLILHGCFFLLTHSISSCILSSFFSCSNL